MAAMYDDTRTPTVPPTPIAGKLLIHAPGKVHDKQVTIRGDRINIRVDYDNGTIIESTICPGGEIEVNINRKYVIDHEKREIRILDGVAPSSSPPRDFRQVPAGRYNLNRATATTDPDLRPPPSEKPRSK